MKPILGRNMMKVFERDSQHVHVCYNAHRAIFDQMAEIFMRQDMYFRCKNQFPPTFPDRNTQPQKTL